MATPHAQKTHVCQICGKSRPERQTVPAALVQSSIEALIRQRKPDWQASGYICVSCLNEFRTDYVQQQMEKDRGELSALETEVVQAIHDNDTVSDNLNREFEKNLTVGDRVADRVATFGGSWRFIMIFFTVMAIWIVINSLYLFWRPFDPYPFILFNLMLSMLAAIQAPIIMMSQNRQEARDRLRAENDYQVNLKAEIEIRTLSEKMDALVHTQWSRLLEIQQIQMDMLRDLSGRHDS